MVVAEPSERMEFTFFAVEAQDVPRDALDSIRGVVVGIEAQGICQAIAPEGDVSGVGHPATGYV